MKSWILAAVAAAALGARAVAAQPAPPPAALYTDPPADAAHPARSAVLHIPTGGVKVNGVAYLAPGAGLHPTVILFHGLPGNEKNLDLAQAIRRAGWNVVTLNYRGSWGSPGTFSFRGNLDDAQAALAYVRDPANAAKLQVDTRRLVLMGHSMGGWVTTQAAGADPDLAGAVLISAADMGAAAARPRDQRIATAADNMETLAGVTAESMADEMATLGRYSFAAAAPGLARHPLLVVTSDDGLAAAGQGLAADVGKRGGQVAQVHLAADHSYNQARIALEAAVLDWLAKLPK